MIEVRRSAERGRSRYGWLDSRHTFSFAGYFDPKHMGLRALRVINEDRVEPGHGFDAHTHRDMEILSWVVEGALEHRDSLGHGSVIEPGELQLMRAGTGVTHSEFNPSETEPVHFLQIWIVPDRSGLTPAYAQRALAELEGREGLQLAASRDGRGGSLLVHQDVDLYVARVAAGDRVEHVFEGDRDGWLQIVRGEVEANGVSLSSGDGAALLGEPKLDLTAARDSELLLFDLGAWSQP